VKRVFNLLLDVMLFTLLAISMLLIAIAIRLMSKGSALYWSDRIEKIYMFKMMDLSH
jgi:O-antigen biosynthesis protein WbqP